MRGVHSIMIRKICKKATVWLLAGVISLSAVTVQAADRAVQEVSASLPPA